MIIVLIALNERKNWWQRNKWKVVRWQYRHPEPKRSRKHTRKKPKKK